MTAVYLSPSIAGMFQSSANLTLRELGSKNQAQAMIPFAGLAPSWTFRFTLPHRHSISSYSTTVPPNPSPLGTCHHSFPNHTQLPPILIHHTFFLCFFVSTPRLRLTMKDDTTKGISPNPQMGSTISATNLMSTRNNPIGASLFPTVLPGGRTCALRASSTLATPSAALFGTHH